MLGKYTIRGMRFHAFHGSNVVEREFGIGFNVEVTIMYPLKAEDDAPDAQSKVQGAAIYETTKDVMMNTKYTSRTSLGLEIAKRLFMRFPDAEEVGVKINRATIFISGSIDSIDTEVWCKRHEFPGI